MLRDIFLIIVDIKDKDMNTLFSNKSKYLIFNHRK